MCEWFYCPGEPVWWVEWSQHQLSSSRSYSDCCRYSWWSRNSKGCSLYVYVQCVTQARTAWVSCHFRRWRVHPGPRWSWNYVSYLTSIVPETLRECSHCFSPTSQSTHMTTAERVAWQASPSLHDRQPRPIYNPSVGSAYRPAGLLWSLESADR